MRNLYDGRVLVIGNAQEQIDRTLKVADQQAPNAFHAFVVDPLMPADRALMVERSTDRLAYIVAPFLPLPGEAEERRRTLLAAALNGAL